MNTQTTIEKLHTVTRYIPDRVRRLYTLGYITPEQKDTALIIRDMWLNPLTRTPEYTRWARHQDTQVIDGQNLNASRMQIVIDVIIQDRSISQVEDSLRMARDTALGHLQAALDDYRARVL